MSAGRRLRAEDLVRYVKSSVLLEELVRRGRVHESRLIDVHEVHVPALGGWSMKHPLSCDLADCAHHQAVAALASCGDLPVGSWRLVNPEGPLEEIIQSTGGGVACS